MNATVTLSFPPASAEKLELDVSPDGTYPLSWIELAFRLTRATGKPELANAETVRRGVTGYQYARTAAEAVLARPDWQEATWQAGLLALVDAPEQVEPSQAACFLECLFLAVFTQPERYKDLTARQVLPEHVAGWAAMLSTRELEDLTGASDERTGEQAEPEGWRDTILAAALHLYLQWSGQADLPNPIREPIDPDVLPIPAEA